MKLRTDGESIEFKAEKRDAETLRAAGELVNGVTGFLSLFIGDGDDASEQQVKATVAQPYDLTPEARERLGLDGDAND